jgi:hypothetical protein
VHPQQRGLGPHGFPDPASIGPRRIDPAASTSGIGEFCIHRGWTTTANSQWSQGCYMEGNSIGAGNGRARRFLPPSFPFRRDDSFLRSLVLPLPASPPSLPSIPAASDEVIDRESDRPIRIPEASEVMTVKTYCLLPAATSFPSESVSAKAALGSRGTLGSSEIDRCARYPTRRRLVFLFLTRLHVPGVDDWSAAKASFTCRKVILMVFSLLFLCLFTTGTSILSYLRDMSWT